MKLNLHRKSNRERGYEINKTIRRNKQLNKLKYWSKGRLIVNDGYPLSTGQLNQLIQDIINEIQSNQRS